MNVTQNEDTKTVEYTYEHVTVRLIKYMGDEKSSMDIVSKFKNLSYTISYINEITFEEMGIKINSNEIQNPEERLNELTFD